MATASFPQSTDFSRDVLGRYVCNGLDEARRSLDRRLRPDARPFDVIVVGGGTFGPAFAQHLFATDAAHAIASSCSRRGPSSGRACAEPADARRRRRRRGASGRSAGRPRRRNARGPKISGGWPGTRPRNSRGLRTAWAVVRCSGAAGRPSCSRPKRRIGAGHRPYWMSAHGATQRRQLLPAGQRPDRRHRDERLYLRGAAPRAAAIALRRHRRRKGGGGHPLGELPTIRPYPPGWTGATCCVCLVSTDRAGRD